MRKEFNQKADPVEAARPDQGQVRESFSRAAQDPNAELKALIAQRKKDLMHAQPSLHPDGAQGPNHRDWGEMREREDTLQAHTKAKHAEQRQTRKGLSQDFDLSS